ncbi:MAG: hypothetical protein ACKOX7_00860 [Bacteroidota bacterium]
MKKTENEISNGLPDKPKSSSVIYKVPDGFFDEFSDRIMSADSSRVNHKPKFRLNNISIAASVSVLAISAALIYYQTQKSFNNNEPSPEDLAHFLVLEGASHEELAQQLAPEQINDMTDESQAEKIYETYLLEQEIDINHINEEL